MTAILLQDEAFDREEFATVLTTLTNRKVKKFPERHVAVGRSVSSVAQVLEEPLEEPRANDLAVHILRRSITRQKAGGIQALASVKQRGEFLNLSTTSILTAILRSQPKFYKQEVDEDLEVDEVEPFWRGVFTLPSSNEVLFSKKIKVKVDELPSWEPYISIDSYRLEDDDE